MQRMIAVTANCRFCTLLFSIHISQTTTPICTNFWWAYRSMGLLTTHQNSTQPDIVWPSKQFVYQNCSVLKWQQTEPIRYLSNPMFYSTNTQTNLRHGRVLSKEWDHQVWSQSDFVWVTNRWLEDVRFWYSKIWTDFSCFSFFASHVVVCVLYSRSLCIAAAAAAALFSEDVD